MDQERLGNIPQYYHCSLCGLPRNCDSDPPCPIWMDAHLCAVCIRCYVALERGEDPEGPEKAPMGFQTTKRRRGLLNEDEGHDAIGEVAE